MEEKIYGGFSREKWAFIRRAVLHMAGRLTDKSPVRPILTEIVTEVDAIHGWSHPDGHTYPPVAVNDSAA